METKSLIRTLKMQRGRYTKNSNEMAERKTIESIVEKAGGKLEVVAKLKEANEQDLLAYVRKVLGIVRVSAEKTTDNDSIEYAAGTNGKMYRIDTVKGTCKKILKDLSELNPDEIDTAEMSMTTYQRYLKDNFPGESVTIKKGKLHFRGYRISCDVENGFMIEDTTKKYAVVETELEGIPTPRELGDWFKKPRVEHTPEELAAAVERGKELARKAKEEQEHNEENEVEEIDYEKLRRKVLKTIKDIRSKTLDFDPTEFPNMIPFKRWKRKANSLVSQWKKREIRYAKFLKELEDVTTAETFVIEEKNHRSAFVGTILPDHETVGYLKGDKLEVDGKLVDAVPFLLDYLLHYEKRAMSQIMKFANGEITEKQLFKNPMEVDWKVEYNKSALKNTAHNAQVLTVMFDLCGLIAPQDLLFEADLEVDDKILLLEDGELKTKTVRKVEQGIEVSGGYGLTKLDKWIKLPNKD